jgi:hypothetical protein
LSDDQGNEVEEKMLTATYVLLTVFGVGSPPANRPSDAPPLELAGTVTRAEVEKKIDGWKQAREQAVPSAETAAKLMKVPAGARVDVYFGTWCGDSRREVPRLWKALEGGTPPFAVHYIAEPRDKARRKYPAGVKVAQLPTFIVTRAGKEVGRVVETAPDGIETDLLLLLSGERTGVISARTDL